MPNNRGGKKFKRGKKFSNFTKQTRELVYKQTDQEYARLDRNLGERRFEIMCSDGVQRIAHVPGSFAKRLWFNAGDYALVSMRSFEPNKCDILYKYNSNEIEQLRSENKLGCLRDDGLNDENEDSLKYTMDVSQIPPKINEQMPDKQMIEEATKDIFEQANQEVMDALNNNLSNDNIEEQEPIPSYVESSKEVEEEKNKINLSPDVDDIMNKIIKNIKIPILVCILFILLTLPQVNKLFV